MRNFWRSLAGFVTILLLAVALAGAPIAVRLNSAVAAYVNTVLFDGTNLWLWSSVSNQLVLSEGGDAGVLTIDALGGPILAASVTSALPTCAASLKGALRVVTDATTPAYNTAITGGGAVVVPVMCNGTAWLTH